MKKSDRVLIYSVIESLKLLSKTKDRVVGRALKELARVLERII